MSSKSAFKAALIATSLIAGLAQAQAAGRLLVTKSSGGGFIMPEWVRGETCKVYEDKVVKTKQFGVDNALVLTQEIPIKISGNIQANIDAAAADKEVHKQNGLCDGPATSISAYKSAADTDGFTLFTTGGCGSDRIERQGASANALRSLADTYCEKTIDFAK